MLRNLDAKITYYDESYRQKIESTPQKFLQQLQGLCIFDIAGIDQSKTRVVTTLIHGNEPSGFIACHQWLKSLVIPKVNVRIILCNLEAAQASPVFSHRYLQDSEDLNRFFSCERITSRKIECQVTQRAQQIKNAILEVAPEAIIDLHNTSGDSAAFAVATSVSVQNLALTQLFADKLLILSTSVGALVEQDFNASVITVECGGAQQTVSHQTASKGLQAFLNQFDFSTVTDNLECDVKVYRDPVRVQLMKPLSMRFAHIDSINTGYNLTQMKMSNSEIILREDIVQLNNQLTYAGEPLGLAMGSLEMLFTGRDPNSIEIVDRYLTIKNNIIVTLVDLQFFMATTDIKIAQQDCLFYLTQVE